AGASRQAAAEGVAEAIRVRAASFANRAECQGSGTIHENGLVQCRQGLERRVGANAADTGKIAVRRIEGLQRWVRHRTVLERVKRTPVTAAACLLFPDLGTVAGRRHEQERRR